MKNFCLAALALLASTTALTACGIGGCGGAPGQAEASIFVSDAATGATVPRVSFYDDNQEINASCQEPRGNACGYYILSLASGHHNLTAKATGYEDAAFTLNLDDSADVHLAVEIHAQP
jgi:hypothetical protein